MGKYRKLGVSAIIFALFCLLILPLFGCVSVMKRQKKQNDLNFKVLDKEKIPEEFKSAIEKSKENRFRLTYVDRGKMYIAEGYGAKKKSGYSVSIEALYETEDYIFVRTKLIGPQRGEKTKDAVTYPYVVVGIEESGKEVVFL